MLVFLLGANVITLNEVINKAGQSRRKCIKNYLSLIIGRYL